MPKTSSGEIDTPKVGSFDNSDNLKCEIDHDRGDCAHTIKKSLAGNSIALDDESSDTMKIFLQIHRGETFALEVNCFGNIGYLKMMVHNKKGIPPGMQRIFFGVKELEVDKTLLDYGVHNQAKLYLVDRKISVMSERTTYQCQVGISHAVESVDQLKEAIRTQGRIQRITYAGKQLEDGHSLSDYGIQREATIDISITYLKVFKVKNIPKTSSGEIVTPKVGSFHNIDEKSSDTKDSQKVIQSKEGESALQSHIYGSKKQVEVVTQCGRTFFFLASCFTTIRAVRMKIYGLMGIPEDNYVFHLCGHRAADEKLLLDYGVRERYTLSMMVYLTGGGGSLSIKRKRTTYHCQVEISGTVNSVNSLKGKFAEHKAIPPAEQRIMFAGQQLEDGHSLSDYGIQREAIVDVSFTDHGDDMRIELAEIQSATGNFDNAYLIDEGGSAKVYKGVLRGKEVAIKKIKPERDETEPNETKYFGTEVAALGACEHPNIVKIIGYYMDEKERIIVSEYVARGSLYNLLHARSPDDAIIDWNARLEIALDIASAMAYLHTEILIIHRDLKTKNILLDEDLRAKVADFGIIKSQADDNGKVYTKLIGTRGYLCSDYVATGSVGTYSDVYAFGVILLELISGKKALDTTTRTLLADWARRLIMDGKHFDLLDPYLVGKIEESVLKDVAKLATKCVAWEKKDRPSMTHIHCELLSMKDKNAKIQNAVDEVEKKPGLEVHFSKLSIAGGSRERSNTIED